MTGVAPFFVGTCNAQTDVNIDTFEKKLWQQNLDDANKFTTQVNILSSQYVTDQINAVNDAGAKKYLTDTRQILISRGIEFHTTLQQLGTNRYNYYEGNYSPEGKAELYGRITVLNQNYTNLNIVAYKKALRDFWLYFQKIRPEYFYLNTQENPSIAAVRDRVKNIEQGILANSEAVRTDKENIERLLKELDDIWKKLDKTDYNYYADLAAFREPYNERKFQKYSQEKTNYGVKYNELFQADEKLKMDLQNAVPAEKTFQPNYSGWKTYIEGLLKELNDMYTYVFQLDLNKEALPESVRTQLASLKQEITKTLFPYAQHKHAALSILNESYKAKNTITQSELNALNAAKDTYLSAYNTFGLKYNDFINLYNANKGTGSAASGGLTVTLADGTTIDLATYRHPENSQEIAAVRSQLTAIYNQVSQLPLDNLNINASEKGRLITDRNWLVNTYSSLIDILSQYEALDRQLKAQTQGNYNATTIRAFDDASRAVNANQIAYVNKYQAFLAAYNAAVAGIQNAQGNAGNIGGTQWGIGGGIPTDPNLNQGQQQGYRQTWSWRTNLRTGRYEYFVNGKPATWQEFRAAGGFIN